jgi:hypothetical protein
MQADFIKQRTAIEAQALQLMQESKRAEAIKLLTEFSNQCGNTAVDKAWETGDLIWTTFDGKW